VEMYIFNEMLSSCKCPFCALSVLFRYLLFIITLLLMLALHRMNGD